MALVPALCFKLDTHDHSWLHSASILAQWKPTPKEHLIFILHLHAVWILLAPAKESSFWFWFFGCLWNSVKFWLLIKEMVACHYQVKLLVSHISTVHASFTQSWVLFPLFLFEKCVGTCMCTCAHMTQCVCESQKAAMEVSSLSTIWAPVADLGATPHLVSHLTGLYLFSFWGRAHISYTGLKLTM